SLLSEPFIYIKSDRHFVRVLLSSICYIESIKNHIRLVTTEQTIITLLSISEIEARLPEQHFLRIHRSYIIALDKIQRFCHTNVEIGENSLPIGRMYKQEVLRRLNAHLL
ncbi:MAG: LytTR family DNA-binding domain-containing protein, partial [Bacteroidota bacterium]